MNWSQVGRARMPAERVRVVISYKAIREELAGIDQAHHEHTKARILVNSSCIKIHIAVERCPSQNDG